jgi:hypothetical protein
VSNAQVKSMLLYGPGGSGKSTLAARSAPRPCLVLDFENGEWPASMQKDGSKIINMCELYDGDPSQALSALNAVREQFIKASKLLASGKYASVIIDSLSVLADWTYDEAQHALSDAKKDNPTMVAARQQNVLAGILRVAVRVPGVIACAHQYEDNLYDNKGGRTLMGYHVLLPGQKLRKNVSTLFRVVLHCTEEDGEYFVSGKLSGKAWVVPRASGITSRIPSKKAAKILRTALDPNGPPEEEAEAPAEPPKKKKSAAAQE